MLKAYEAVSWIASSLKCTAQINWPYTKIVFKDLHHQFFMDQRSVHILKCEWQWRLSQLTISMVLDMDDLFSRFSIFCMPVCHCNGMWKMSWFKSKIKANDLHIIGKRWKFCNELWNILTFRYSRGMVWKKREKKHWLQQTTCDAIEWHY